MMSEYKDGTTQSLLGDKNGRHPVRTRGYEDSQMDGNNDALQNKKQNGGISGWHYFNWIIGGTCSLFLALVCALISQDLFVAVSGQHGAFLAFFKWLASILSFLHKAAFFNQFVAWLAIAPHIFIPLFAVLTFLFFFLVILAIHELMQPKITETFFRKTLNGESNRMIKLNATKMASIFKDSIRNTVFRLRMSLLPALQKRPLTTSADEMLEGTEKRSWRIFRLKLRMLNIYAGLFAAGEINFGDINKERKDFPRIFILWFVYLLQIVIGLIFAFIGIFSSNKSFKPEDNLYHALFAFGGLFLSLIHIIIFLPAVLRSLLDGIKDTLIWLIESLQFILCFGYFFHENNNGQPRESWFWIRWLKQLIEFLYYFLTPPLRLLEFLWEKLVLTIAFFIYDKVCAMGNAIKGAYNRLNNKIAAEKTAGVSMGMRRGRVDSFSVHDDDRADEYQQLMNENDNEKNKKNDNNDKEEKENGNISPDSEDETQVVYQEPTPLQAGDIITDGIDIQMAQMAQINDKNNKTDTTTDETVGVGYQE